MDQMSLEEALFALSADKSADTREGQTWHENLGDENLQCQVINGTTYFTPVNQNKTKERSVIIAIYQYNLNTTGILVINRVGQCLYQMEQPLVNMKMIIEVMVVHRVGRCVFQLPLVVMLNRVPVECILLLLRNSNREILNYEDKFHNLNQWDQDLSKT